MNEPIYKYIVHPVTGERESRLVGYNVLDSRNLTLNGVSLSDWRSSYDGRYGFRFQNREVGGYITQKEMRQAKNVPAAAASGADWLKSSQMSPQALSVVYCACGRRITITEAKARHKRCRNCRSMNQRLQQPKTGEGRHDWARRKPRQIADDQRRSKVVCGGTASGFVEASRAADDKHADGAGR